MPNYITYSFEEIVRWAVIFALTMPRDGYPIDPLWDKRLQDIVNDITGQQSSSLGSSAEELMRKTNRHPGGLAQCHHLK
ncbi:hypothetical protein [Microvirga rosea]|uniref:hypothetical protein n=1 Tax=Microvirga rosea TaxID=2715425 RepID=UPI001D0B40D2|nr:hypothetical protein [Microvirga rosea]MCB8823317.1 hypothetical protein [Microvirga rosea]